jgi:hypothetical protein
MKNDVDSLANEIATAARKAFLDLFSNGERYYYCTLVIFEGYFPPFISAWSWEALERESKKQASSEDAKLIKWSYADSPYCAYGQEHFDANSILSKRPFIYDLDDEEWDDELDIRLKAMELAMKKLDAEGIFELNQPRSDIFINAEIMPPDGSNTKRARNLNSPEAMRDWLAEAAEPE